jgi:Peptidase family M48
MTLSYIWRLIFLSAAVFFLLNLALGAVVALASPFAIRLAERTAPRRAARLLLLLRLSPTAVASLVVLAVCVPSYLWLEPGSGDEHVGAACLAAAALAVVVSISAAARVCRAAIRSRDFLRHHTPSLAIAGILRPRLIVSPAVLRTLTPEQLETALDHERAHWLSHDNLKRLLMLFSPGLLPFYSGFGRIERAWARFTEWAADDTAAAGSATRALSLAGALVHVARLQTTPPPPLATSLLGEAPDLAARVTRLLHPEQRPVRQLRSGATIGAAMVLSTAFAVILLDPRTLNLAHSLLERLME